MENLAVYIPMECRKALADGVELPDRATGAALFVDISGFTPLTAAFSLQLGPELGAEELTHQLNDLFDGLVEQAHRFKGSVIGFSGDAMTCWFDQSDNGDRAAAASAIAAAFGMQAVLARFPTVATPDGSTFPLAIKVAVVAGDIRRFVIGQPDIQQMECLAGATVGHMAAAEGQAEAGEVVVGEEVALVLGDRLDIDEWRTDPVGNRFAVVTKLNAQISALPWPVAPDLDPEVARSWLLPLVYERLHAGHGDYLAELRNTVALFLKFDGIEYDLDDDAGTKLNAFISWVQRVLLRYGGYIMHVSMGDKGSYMNVAFGALTAHEDDAARAVAAALELLSPPSELGAVRDIQIGIAQDQVYVGGYGGRARRTYSVLGNEVNVGARLMSNAAPHSILVSARVVTAVQSDYEFGPMEVFDLKGLAESVLAAPLLRQRRVESLGGVTRENAQAALVGRAAEQTMLKEMLQALDRGESGVLLIEGEAGIGKTRLVEELFREAGTRVIARLLGAGDAIERATAYHAWKPIFVNLLDLNELASQEQTESRQAEMLALVERQLDVIDSNLLRLMPLLTPLLPLEIADNDLTAQMSGLVRADNTQNLLVRILQSTADEEGLLVVLEDAHWLDSASWALALAASRSVQPLLLIIAARPPSQPIPSEYIALMETTGSRRMRLDTLPPDEVEALIAIRLGVLSLPAPMAKLLRDKAEGHPFFSEELAYALRDTGLVIVEDGACRIASQSGDLSTVDFPDTIQGVITSRIDNVTPQQQLALKVASVIGRIFAFQTLSDTYPVEADRANLPIELTKLESLDITLLETPEPDLAYIFKHIITQEVAYGLLLYRQRVALHRTVAAWYEDAHADDLVPLFGVLAYHWGRAAQNQHEDLGLVEKAIEYLEKAGEQALLNYANREAIRLLDEAIELDQTFRGDRPAPQLMASTVTNQDFRRARRHSQLAEAYLRLGDYALCEDHVRRGLTLLDRPLPTESGKQVAGVVKQIGLQSAYRLPTWRNRQASLSENERALTLEIVRFYRAIARVFYHTNDASGSMYVNTHRLNLAERLGPSPDLADVYGSIGLTLGWLQLKPLARSYGRRSVAVARETGNLEMLINVYISRAVYEIGLGNWPVVSEDMEEGREIAARLGDFGHWGDCMAVMADSALFCGNMERSLDLYQELLASAQNRDNALHECWSMRGRVVDALRKGDAVTAAAILDRTLALLDQITDPPTKIDTYGLLAVTKLRLGEIEEALETAGIASSAIAEVTPPVSYPQYLGHGSVAEVYLTLWERSQMEEMTNFVNFAEESKKACKRLATYRRIFAIGRPQAAYFQGRYEWLCGQQRKAHKVWRKGVRDAKILGMPFEEALLHREIGRRLAEDDPERGQHRAAAETIFTRLGATYFVAASSLSERKRIGHG